MKSFDDAQFWNSKVRTPVCYNAPATRTVLRYTLFRSQLALAGATEAQLLERVRNGVANGSPVVYDNAHKINPEPWSPFFIPVPHWSDGSSAPH